MHFPVPESWKTMKNRSGFVIMRRHADHGGKFYGRLIEPSLPFWGRAVSMKPPSMCRAHSGRIPQKGLLRLSVAFFERS